MNDEVEVSCPYCGEPSTITVQDQEDDGAFVQDCPVCCRPWQVHLKIRRDGSVDISITAEGQ